MCGYCNRMSIYLVQEVTECDERLSDVRGQDGEMTRCEMERWRCERPVRNWSDEAISGYGTVVRRRHRTVVR